jgi:hypothetical protein
MFSMICNAQGRQVTATFTAGVDACLVAICMSQVFGLATVWQDMTLIATYNRGKDMRHASRQAD